MNSPTRAQTLLESIQQLLEGDPFKALGYRISKHTFISPDDKKLLLRKRKRIGDRVETSMPNDRKRKVAVYKHQDQFVGHIQHFNKDNHPMDSHFYELEPTRGQTTNDKKQSTRNTKKTG